MRWWPTRDGWRQAPARIAHLWRASLQLRTVAITLLLTGVAILVTGVYMALSISNDLYQSRLDQALRDSSRATTTAQSTLNASDVSSGDAGKNLLAALTTTYPLQHFSRCYFGAGEDARVFTYAREWQQAHQPAPAALPASTLAPWQPDVALGIGALQRFLPKPVAYFFNQRLNVFFA